MSNVEETELTHRMKGGAEPKVSEAGVETDHSQRIQTHDGKNRLKVRHESFYLPSMYTTDSLAMNRDIFDFLQF